MTSIAIFGCGPSGLFAAWAAIQCGADVRIISKKRRSELFGAQYLHHRIPEIPAKQIQVEYKLLGTENGYRNRVYGSRYTGQTSVNVLTGSHTAWDIRGTYNALYTYFEGKIEPVKTDLDAALFGPLVGSKAFATYDLIVNTIPRPSLCMKPDTHKFEFQRIWAVGDAPERGIKVPVDCPESTVMCNGEGDDSQYSWYRMSNVFGHTTVEWPSWYFPGGLVHAAEVKKPLSNECDCNPHVVNMGRFGKWQKGVLSHEAYDDMIRILS